MKYFIIYVSSASKLEVEEFSKFENVLTRKEELNAKMIAARIIGGVDLSTELAQVAHKKDLELLAASEESEDLEGHEVTFDGPLSEDTTEVTDAASNGVALTEEVQTLPESDIEVTLKDVPHGEVHMQSSETTEGHDPDLHSHGNEVEEAKTVVDASH